MPTHRLGFLFLALIFCASALIAQEVPPRDARAVALLTQSVAAMGGTPPADSVATGRITIEAGSATRVGRVKMLTKGLSETAEFVDAPDLGWNLGSSASLAREKRGGVATTHSLEFGVTTVAENFPLVLLSRILGAQDSAFLYVGLEDVNAVRTHHIRFWKVFSKPEVKHLEEFSSVDIWIGSTSGLPTKLSYVRREAKGDVGFPVEVHYGDFREVEGYLYPHSIKKTLNGTPWATIDVERVRTNVGLTDADLSVQ